MPQELTGPGVHIEEQPGPVHAISGMDTAVTAFIGSAPQGLVDHPAVVTSWAEYTALFGFPAGAGRLGAAVGLYFLNGGQRALIVRVAGGGTTVEDHVPADPGSGRGLYALDTVDA